MVSTKPTLPAFASCPYYVRIQPPCMHTLLEYDEPLLEVPAGPFRTTIPVLASPLFSSLLKLSNIYPPWKSDIVYILLVYISLHVHYMLYLFDFFHLYSSVYICKHADVFN